LVADDNRDAADSIGLLISELGAGVRIAYDGVQALQVLREFDPALMLLDIGMPDQEADRKRTAAAGFDAHLTKPVSVVVALSPYLRAVWLQVQLIDQLLPFLVPLAAGASEQWIVRGVPDPLLQHDDPPQLAEMVHGGIDEQILRPLLPSDYV
jgi:CheY-like chemotaxis protein